MLNVSHIFAVAGSLVFYKFGVV